MTTAHPLGFWWAWPAALLTYILFRAWYDNWRGPLSSEEIEQFMKVTADSPGPHHTDRAVLREFLEADDGKEFVMCNLIKLFPTQLPTPSQGNPHRHKTCCRPMSNNSSEFCYLAVDTLC